MPFTSSSLWPETAAGSSASTASTADTGGSGGPPLPSSWMGDSTSSGGWSQQVGSATGIDFEENLTSLEGPTSDGSYNALDSRSRPQDDQVMMLDAAAYMPLLSSSQFNFPSNYFSSWSGTAPRPVPVPSSSSNPSTTFAPTRMQNLPPLPSSQLPSSSSQATPEAPLSRYAQLVQAKMRNTSLASASSSSSSGSSSNSLWNVPPPPKAPVSAPQSQLGIWSNPTPPGGPRMDQMREQQLLDFQQGPNVCNSSFIGYNKEPTNFGLGSNSSSFGGLSGVAGEVQSDLAGERSTRGESSQVVDTSKQEEQFRSRGVTASPASSSSQSSSRRGDKRKHPSGETQEEQQQEGLWGHPRPSHQPSPSSSFSSSVIPSDTPPFPNTSTSSPSASSLSQFSASNWFPSSSSSSLLPSSYLPISTPTPTDYQATLNSYHTSSFQPGTGYAALPTPTVGRYPSASTEDAAWWTRINLTSNDPLPEVDASFVQSVFGPTTGASASSQSVSGGNQQSSSRGSFSQDRYSYVASAHARQDPRSSASGSSGSGELSRYQQLMAAKYAASNPTPPNTATHSSTSLTPNFQTSTLASTSSPSPTLNAHLASVSPLEYSQYPISSKYPSSSSSALYSVNPVNYSQSSSSSSSSSQHQSFPVPQPSRSPRSTSSSFSSYFAGSSTGLGGYQSTGAAAGGLDSSGWAQKPYEDTSTSRHSNRSQSWRSAEASSSSSINSSSLSTLMAPPYTNPLPLLHLPPTPTLSKPHRSPRPPVPAPPSVALAAPPSTIKTQLQDSLLLPTVLSGRPLVPILPRPPPAPTNFIATTTPSTSASLSPPSPLQPLLAMSSLPSPSFTSLPLLTPTNHSSSSSSSGASSSSMLPPPVPSSKLAVGPPPVPSFNSDEWESIAPLGGVPQRKGKPRAKKAKKEVSPEEESGEREEREGSASSTSGKGEDKKKKLLLACHFCRGRKLKCDGNRVQCANCVLRGTPCTYDTEIRRRGPGRKKIQLGGDGDEPYRDPNSTASKPTRMKGVGSGHGLKMSKVVKKEPAPEPAPIASSSHGSTSAEDEDGEGEEDEGEEEEGGIGELGVMGWTG